MRECICSSCVNLKGIIDENGRIREYECEYGSPSEDCAGCPQEECEAECSHYISDEEERTVVMKCSGCGKELKQYGNDREEGAVYCVECYMKNV